MPHKDYLSPFNKISLSSDILSNDIFLFKVSSLITKRFSYLVILFKIVKAIKFI